MNGSPIFTGVTKGTAASFSIVTRVRPGDLLDFAVDPGGAGNLGAAGIDAANDGCDLAQYLFLGGPPPAGGAGCVPLLSSLGCAGSQACY
ncbi:MAG: hypothetical protein HY721_10650 [Planctomycetes bacterium]|nr:hypothetical protein [Planctomycetota bacterium]